MLTPLQQKLLDMLSWFHEFCVSNHLRYYLIEGSMLGAARHHGFIPWDDDVDVGMPRRDYDRLMEIFSDSNNKYVLETPYSQKSDYIYPCSKLYDATTTYVEKARKICKRGIFIDVFPLDGMGNTIEESKKYYEKIDFLNMLLATRVCALSKDRAFVKNASIIVSRIIPDFIIPVQTLLKRIDTQCKQKDYDDCEYVTCAMSTYRDKEIIERSVYGEPQLYDFEDIQVYGVEHYDEYLAHIYGNWRKLPSKEQQMPRHNYVYIDLEKSYIS